MLFMQLPSKSFVTLAFICLLLSIHLLFMLKSHCCSICRYLLEEKSDDSILLLLVIRIMDALGNYGNKYTFLPPTPFLFFLHD